jgi:hypothetical protein
MSYPYSSSMMVGSVQSSTRGAPTAAPPFAHPDQFQPHIPYNINPLSRFDMGLAAAGGTVYTDSGTANVVLTATRTADNIIAVDAGTSIVVLTPRESDLEIATDKGTSIVIFTPKETDFKVYPDAGTATVVFTPRVSDLEIAADAPRSTVIFTPRVAENILAVDSGRNVTIFTAKGVDTYIPAAPSSTGMAYRRLRYKRQ